MTTSIPEDADGLKKLIASLIKTGRNLDHLFSFGKTSGWSYQITEDLIESYQQWALRCYLLLRSEYAVAQDWQLQYPILSENDGVSGLVGFYAMSPSEENFNITNKGLRLGVSYEDDEKRIVSTEEGIAQFNNAHASLKRKIEILAQILKSFSIYANKTGGKFYITKDDARYYFDGNLVYFKSKNAQYAVMFDVVYSLKPLGGKVEYKKIIEQCKKRRLKNVGKKSVLRALTGKDANLFKYVKEIKQEPAYGISLFVAMQNGTEIEFNNKK